ncbi:MAG: methionine synthase [Prevotella sp.]|jgi:5-methyltetrahydrofolate--homocysteine methyltransferase
MREDIATILRHRVMVLDGSMGVMIQQLSPSEGVFRGERFKDWPVQLKGDNDLLCLTKPDAIKQIHRHYLEAGADIIETNTFNAQAISQEEYGMQAYVTEINRAAVRIAREEADRMTARTPDKPRFVAGAVGPTGKTASMSQHIEDPASRSVTYDQLRTAYHEQMAALVDAGVDLLLIETAFDTLNVKAALRAAEDAFSQTSRRVPIIVSLTIADTGGRMLAGQNIEAFVTTVSYAKPLAIGINCSFGPAQLRPFIKQLSDACPFYTCAYPNAGLPDEMGEYSESPDSMASYMRGFLDDGLLNIAGGCCGSTPQHIARIAEEVEAADNPRTLKHNEPAWLAGLDAFRATPGVFINVGERCNVAGSRKFLRLISEKKYEEALAIARKQVEDGAMVLDINMDDGMLDSVREMRHFVNLMAADPQISRIPWMIDSSQFEVVEEALKCIQGKAIVNSISLKEGEEEFLRKAAILKQYGVAVVVMAFDEQGQAVTFSRKTAICQRAYDLLTTKVGMCPADIIFDPNVLTIATGIKEHRRYALDFIETTRWIHRHLPGVKVSGGVSNLSFAFRGNNYLREAMHAVFLYHAIEAGLDMAILNPATQVMYDHIPHELLKVLEDTILCRTDDAEERLVEIAGKYADKKVSEPTPVSNLESMSLKERLIYALQFGEAKHLESDLHEALATYGSPQAIIDGPLMEGMTLVGDLFGEGKMFLPQVVKTARTMKTAVEILNPYITKQKKNAGHSLGKFLLATVKGDVHDIGKNITAIVLGCNNFDVIDLGVMVEAERIVQTAKAEGADFIALSGLITPSLNEMCNVAKELDKAGVSIPLFIGGATTSALHTATRIAPLYRGPVIYVKDASQDAIIAHKLLGSEREEFLKKLRADQEHLRNDYEKRKTSGGNPTLNSIRKIKIDWSREPIDRPSFIGVRSIAHIPIAEIRPYINWISFSNLWQVRRNTPESKDVRAEAETLLNTLTREGMTLTALVGFFQAYSENDAIVILQQQPCCDSCHHHVVIPTPRQHKAGKTGYNLALCDFIAPKEYHDHVGCFAVTLSTKLVDRLEAVKKEDNAYEALLLQGICDRLVEAASEWLHARVRKQLWGYGPDEHLSIKQMYSAAYRGIRPAIGYPSLPDQQQIFKLDQLLNLNSIGIKLTENGAMYPQASTCGLYLASPHSTYFVV